MISYFCELCEYKTDRSHDMKVHLRCKKHLKNVGMNDNNELNELCLNDTIKFDLQEEEICEISQEEEKKPKKVHSCEFCKNSFSCYQNMWRHKKTCKQAGAIHKLQQENIDLKEQVILVTEKMDKLTNVIEKSLKFKNSTKLVTNSNPINININNSGNTLNANSTLTNISNVLKYVNQNYQQAKPLEALPPNEARKLLLAKQDKNHSVEEFMLYYYDKHLFDQFIGDVIVSVFKKEDSTEQQIWASDVERLSFIIRRVLEENEKLWMKDLKGVTITKYIVSPILTEVRLMIQEYHKKCVMEMNGNGKSLDDLEKMSNYAYNCIKLIRDINDKVIHDDILRYIIPKFQLQITN